jgi:hypothetical protein
MTKTLRLLLIAAALTGPAIADNDTGYDPGRSCRSYALQRLPVPVRCMVELLGNWSPKPYIDGEFMFRNREEWLAWKDREDYHHWKNHDYAWHAGMPVTPPPAAPMPPAPVAASNQTGAALFCPREVSVRVQPEGRTLEGWSATDAVAVLHLEGMPRAEAGTLFCSYGAGRDHLTLTRPAWGRCVARTDGSGFDCSP